MNAAICSDIVAMPPLPDPKCLFSTPRPATPLRRGACQDLVRVQLADGDGVRGTPLQAQVTEDAFLLMRFDHPGQLVASLKDAHRADRNTRRTGLALSTARLIHVNG